VEKMIEEKLKLLQEEMELKLKKIQVTHQHKGNRGDNAEEIVKDFIREYLPPYYRVGNGEVIDTHDNISNETDVVILNEHHPFLNDLTNPSLFFIEGVAAAGEVKSNLSSKDLDTTLIKCHKFKTLSPYFTKGTKTFCNDSDLKRYVERRPFFLFAFKSQLTIETIFKKVVLYNQKHALDMTQQIDGIFLLDRGYILNFGDGQGALSFQTNEGELAKGYIPFLKENQSNILFNFLTWLSTTIPRIEIYDSILIQYLMKGRII
jgi:hypothetical protein